VSKVTPWSEIRCAVALSEETLRGPTRPEKVSGAAGANSATLRLSSTILNIARCAAMLLALCGGVARAQAPERTIDEIRIEAQARADRGNYPLIGLDPADVRDALAPLRTRDPDEWAASWSRVADRYMADAAANPGQADANYVRAWRLYYFAQWPVPSSAGKQAAYRKALDAYARHIATLDPKVETVHIPFEGGTITGYLRLPKGTPGPVPLILAISGLDSRKETIAETYNAIIPSGVGYLAVDSPGTGQAPIKVSPTADRMFSAVLDYLQTRPEVDAHRIIAHGVSFGGYWATKLAITEHGRLLGVVVQSPPVDTALHADFLRTNLLGNREYLFDVVPAFLNVVEGGDTIDKLAEVFPKLSLVAQGLIGKPTGPMLIVGGAKDTQVPISDLDLLLHTGDVPKDAWINPQGGHLGREPRGWTDPVIFRRVIMPWELRLLRNEAGSGAP
jgi:esterase FrsA